MANRQESVVINKDLLVEADSFFDDKFKKKMRLALLLVDIQCWFILRREWLRKKLKKSGGRE